jgi:NADPH:quinone reductase-like Zn-dependent oxidoreductase
MKALVIKELGVPQVVSDRPLPALRPDHIRVKVHAVALNPTDHKHIDKMPDLAGCLVGMDFAGVVESIADGDLTRQFKIGDRVAGTVHGCKCHITFYFFNSLILAPLIDLE